MAKKSKTQKAKASAARQQRKAERARLESSEPEVVEEPKAKAGTLAKEKVKAAAGVIAEDLKEDNKKALVNVFKRKLGKESSSGDSNKKKETTKAEKSSGKKVKKHNRFVQFFIDVRSEMKRVTWPTRVDVLRWTGVVVVALLFFGLFTFILDNGIVTPLLVFISGLGT